MNVYDFDNTIYNGDSSIDFFLYCCKKNPRLLKYLFIQIYWIVAYAFGFCSKRKVKEKFFYFVKEIDTQENVEKFWNKNITKIKSWYLNQMQNDDVIVSASPDFLICSGLKKIGINNCICSVVSTEDGTFKTENCYGEEKLTRFCAKYPEAYINNFYSDSISDNPLAMFSENAFMVNKDKIFLWSEYKTAWYNRLFQMLKTKEFVKFLVVGIINVFNGVFWGWSFLNFFDSANLSFVLAYSVSVSISYILNTIITFKSNLSFLQYLRYCMSYIPNFVIQNTAVFVFHNIFLIKDIVSYCLAAMLSVPLTFIILKIKVFKKDLRI